MHFLLAMNSDCQHVFGQIATFWEIIKKPASKERQDDIAWGRTRAAKRLSLLEKYSGDF